MSEVRLGPVTMTNSPLSSRSAQAPGHGIPGRRQVLGQLIDPGDDHAGRRQVAEQAILGRGTGDKRRAGVGQEDIGRHNACPEGRPFPWAANSAWAIG